MDLDATAWLALAFQLTAFYLFPVILWIALSRRLGVGWRSIGLGSVSWLTALPAIVVVPMLVASALGGGDHDRMHLVWGWALSLTAALVEESSRYFWYRRSASLRDPAGRRFALAAGAGHGGTEALVLGLQFAIGPIVAILYMPPEALPPEFSTSAGIAWFAVIGGLSRLLIVVAHMGLALMVWRAVSQRRIGWYFAAMATHATLDLLAFVMPDALQWLFFVPTIALVGFVLVQLRAELTTGTSVPGRPSGDTSPARAS